MCEYEDDVKWEMSHEKEKQAKAERRRLNNLKDNPGFLVETFGLCFPGLLQQSQCMEDEYGDLELDEIHD